VAGDGEMLNSLMDAGGPPPPHHHTAHHLASMGLKMSPPLEASPATAPAAAAAAAAAAAIAADPFHQSSPYGSHQLPHPGYAARDFLSRREHHDFPGSAPDPTAMLFPTALHHQVVTYYSVNFKVLS